MTKRLRIALLGLLALIAGESLAHGYQQGELGIRHPWTRATPPGATVAAGFLEIRNADRQGDRLIGATTPAAERVELHVMERGGEVVRMRERTELEIPARQRLVLRPGGTHLMLVGLRRPFVKGERVPLTLRFERSGEIEVLLEVQAPGSRKGHH